jgi:hypothetical protein
MSEQSLFDELVAQIRVSNPNATEDEISDGIDSLLSKEILPIVLKNLSLPKFPSARDESFEAKRLKSSQGSKMEKIAQVHQRRSLIQQVEQVRNAMGWDGINDTTPKMQISNSSSIYPLIRLNFASKNEKIRKPIKKIEAESEMEKETINATAQKINFLIDKNVIDLSESTQRKIVSEPLFETFFKGAEIKMRQAVSTREPETKIEVLCNIDEESPDRTKCLVKIHPRKDLDFKGRMKLSTVFDIIIRTEIRSLQEKADIEGKKYLQGINRNLFVHVDL